MKSNNNLPKILKGNENKKSKSVKESGCCFTSCGGSPVNQDYEESSNTKTEKVLEKIK
ncbi:MAG: hypothetical protein PHT82_02890 [Candidatus Portnoybacteria bacterium]|jgi:hypothetical protein|nr:hypothetical protein [Candidatus Portnoybacteria bacterium]